MWKRGRATGRVLPMKVQRGSRALALAIGVVTASVLLVGCSPISFVRTVVSATQPMPKVGQCWLTTYSDIGFASRTVVPRPVDCSHTHESLTVAVPTLTGKFPSTWDDGSGKNVRTDVSKAAADACVSIQKRILPGMTPDTYLLQPNYKLPTLAAWARGARWVRCDVSEIAVNTQVASPQLTTVPTLSNLKTQLATDPNQFAYCIDSAQPYDFDQGPKQAGARFATCDGAPDWSIRATITIPDTQTGEYPGTAAMENLGTAKCLRKYASSSRHAYYYFPTESAWDDGDRVMHCWVSASEFESFSN
jgi:hypothetical protein